MPTIAGTLYSDNGVTPVSGATIRFSVNGGALSGVTATTAADGTFTSGSISVSINNVITVLVSAGGVNSVTLYIASSTSNNISGLLMYGDTLMLQRPTGTVLGSFSTANINTSDASGAAGISAIYSCDGTSLTLASGKHLYVNTNATLPSFTNLTVPGNITSVGTFNSPSTAGSCGGNISTTNNTTTTGTWTLSGSSKTLSCGGNWPNVTISGSYTLTANLILPSTRTLTTQVGSSLDSANFTVGAGSFSISSGTFTTGSSIITLSGTGSQTIDFNVSTLVISAASTTSVTSTISSQLTVSGNASINISNSVPTVSITNTTGVTLTASLTVTSSITIGTNGIFILNGNNLVLTGSTFTNSGTLRLKGSETLTDFTGFTNSSSAGTVTYQSTDNTTYNGLPTGSYNHWNLTINSSGSTYNLNNNLVANNALTITAGTLDTTASNYNVTCGTYSNSGTFVPHNSTLSITKTGNFNPGGLSYYNLNLGAVSVSANINLLGNLIVTNTFSIIGNSQVQASGRNLTLTGATFNNAGTIVLQGNEILTGFVNDLDSGTIAIQAAGAIDSSNLNTGSLYYNFIIAEGTQLTLSSQLIINSLQIGTSLPSTASLDVSTSNYQINVNTTFAIYGTFIPRNGTIIIGGSGVSNLYSASVASGGTGSVSLYNLTCQNATELIFISDVTYNVAGSLTLTGTSGQNLALTNGIAADNKTWTINATGSTILRYINVSDSVASTPLTAFDSIDGGRNTGWTFSGPASPVTATLTQTLQDTILSSTANIIVNGNLTQTLDNIVLTSQANIRITGSLTQTLANTALTSQANVLVRGSLVQTLENTILSSTALIRSSSNITGHFELTPAISGGLSISESIIGNFSITPTISGEFTIG